MRRAGNRARLSRIAAGLAFGAAALAGCTAGGDGDRVHGESGAAGSEGAPVAGENSRTQPAIVAPTVAARVPGEVPTVAGPRIGFHPTAEEWGVALEAARGLTLSEAAGQVIVAAVSAPDPEAARALVADHHLGGVILMGGAVTDAQGVSALTTAVASADDRDWPVWIATDEEGGPVSRLAGVVRPMPAFMAAGAARDKDAVTAAYAGLGRDLHALGINVDFAPVADVTIGLADPIIRTRSAGSDPTAVGETVVAASTGFAHGGVVPVIKHFPGHGSVTTDSHHDLPVQERSVEEILDTDVAPFATAIDAGAPVVMMGHIAIPEWGAEPATLEPAAYAHLREELGFDGVVVTDALNMGAIANHHGAGEAAVMALAAGADTLLMPASVNGAIEGIVEAVESGRLDRARLDEAAARTIALMRWAGGIEPGDPAVLEGDALADLFAGDYARALAAAGATVATADCSAPLVGEAATVTGGTDAQRATLEAALEARGVALGGGASVRLIASGTTAATADVVVVLGDPWHLDRSDAGAYVALYGRTASALEGLADVLTGAVPPGGDWPVDLDLPWPAC
ncbi:glycoside hydrolase family 3 N-terminal domain-containing protein [Demequina pelophila]|uniref:glycoside hydrolase family 3 N-terminal domain-containing protein n=1 Tax=Demequina pelophila TaxID=1638984 RepID=UPI000781A66A|nr:glycoside hydrolase family 3 N-terminal domain-containing protein [Demequina pelophila]